MRIAAFFVLLCFFLPGSDAYAQAGVQRKVLSYSQALHITDKGASVHLLLEHKQRLAPVPDYTLTKDTDQDEEFLVSDDIEDEDANSFFAKKFRLTDGCLSTFCYQFIPDYHHNPSKVSLAFFGLTSQKYILQRTLRI